MAASASTALIIGASRGLGAALVEGLAEQGWQVIGTVRGSARTPLHDVADRHPDHVAIEQLDITAPDQIAALHDRLAGRTIDILFVNAGIAPGTPFGLIGDDPDAAFAEVMATNALAPMRVIDALKDLVPGDGLIGAMSSGQGSLANSNGRNEIYRASKAALNMLVKSFAARPEEARRAVLLLAPGWVATDLGGGRATYTLDETQPLLIEVLLAKRGKAGIDYLDRFGATVPW